MKPINEILINKNTHLAKLFVKSAKNRELNNIFKNILDGELKKHTHFAKISKEILIVTVDSAAWATRLRFTIPEILKNLNTQIEFKEIKKIRYVIVPNDEFQPIKATKKKISAENEKIWRETIKNISN